MNILVVFTGGTIGSVKNGEVISADNKCANILIDMYKRRFDGADFTVACPYTVLSENLSSENLNSLYECISSYDINDFDGVIVTHGTDTLQYTSAFLGYAFFDCKIPVVVVSANFPLDNGRSNGFENFKAAVDFIGSKEGKGVFVSYTNKGESTKIHRAARLLEHIAYSDNVYSIFNEFYGEIIDGRFVKNINYNESDNRDFLRVPVKMPDETGVIMLKSYFAMTYPEILGNTKAVLIEGYHSGTLNTDSLSIAEFCKKADELNVPVFLTGACDGFGYESKLMFDKLKIKVLPPASPIAMYIKLCLLDKDNIDNIFIPCADDFIFQ